VSDLVKPAQGVHVFAFGGQQVRTAGTFDAPLFCAADVCAILTLGDVRRACERIDPEDVHLEHHAAAENKQNGVTGGQAIRGVKRSLYVTESGLYALIFGSEKPEAKAFKRWVTAEVLPAIRKYGFYSAVEEAQRKQTELLLEEIFPNLPTRAQPIFRELIASLLQVRREERASGNPPWARSLASTVYHWALKVDGQQQFRRAKNPKPSGSRVDYSMFSDVADDAVRRVVTAGCDYAKISTSWDDWKAKMAVLFESRPLQLSFGDRPALPSARRLKIVGGK
jgi:prophage antirepressor-like protein